jgi:hypothetical protein
MLRATVITMAAIILYSSCKKNNEPTCEGATLYYTPNCATIKGYVVFDNTNDIRVFQHNIDMQFRDTGIKVCISYEHLPDGILTADCMTRPPIKILSIKRR